MRRLIFNKKGVLGETLTWFPTMIIVFLLITIYFISLGWLSVRKDPNEINLPGPSFSVSEIQRKLDFFMNSPITLNGQEIIVKDLIKGEPSTDKEKFDKFKELSQKFLYDNANPSDDNLNDKLTSWIRIYDISEAIYQRPYKDNSMLLPKDIIYSDYEVEIRPMVYNKMADPCDPSSPNSYLFLSYSKPNKKIVLCLEEKK